MSLYLDTRGQSTLGIGICDRCKRKFPLASLKPDRNTPGLMVCEEDNDVFDPWRLPARQAETITLPFTRPDVNIAVAQEGEEQTLRILDDHVFYRDTDDEDYLREVIP